MKKLKVGLLGMGRIGRLHGDNITYFVKNAEIVAAADPMLNSTMEEWAAELGIPKVYSDPMKVVQDPEVEAVFICTSTPAHAELSIAAAKAAARADAGLAESDVTFTKEKLDWDDGIAVYDIEFLTADTEYDYEIDAATGAVLDKSAELFRPNESQGQAMDASIGVESAKEIAAAHAGLSKEEVFFTKAELELEHGRSEYEIEFYHDRIEYEYTIDAATGAILEYKSEYDH